MPVTWVTKLKSHQIYLQRFTEELIIMHTVLARRLYGITCISIFSVDCHQLQIWC